MPTAVKEKKSTLDEIVEQLHPEAIQRKIGIPHAEIRNKYKLDKVKLDDHDAFRNEIIKYVKHHWKEWYKGEISDEEAFGHAHQLLEAVFEKEGGYRHAYKLAKEGKMKDVIDSIASGLEQTATSSHITNALGKIDPNDYDKQTEIVSELMDRHAGLFPKDMKKKDPKHLARDYRNFTRAYANMVAAAKEQYGKEK